MKTRKIDNHISKYKKLIILKLKIIKYYLAVGLKEIINDIIKLFKLDLHIIKIIFKKIS